MAQRVYLVSKTLDPVLGMISGIWAYHLYENNERSGIAPDRRLVPLLRRALDERRTQQVNSAGAGGEDELKGLAEFIGNDEDGKGRGKGEEKR